MASPQHDLLRILVFLLYVPALFVAFWKLIPRLSSFAKALATTLLLAQIIVVALAVQLEFDNSVLRKLVDVDKERNLAAGLAGLQLALVASYALLNAWLARARPRWLRFYFLGMSVVFFYLAWDELFVVHEGIGNHWVIYYSGVGALVVAATLVIARRSPRPPGIWPACTLAGLAIGALGAMALELLRWPNMCLPLGLYYIDRCLLKYIEEQMEFLGMWLVLVAMLGWLTELAPWPKRRLRLLLYGLPILALLAIVNFGDPDLRSVERSIGAVLTDLRFETGARVYGYQTEVTPSADHIETTLWLSAPPFGYDGLGYSIHLFDPAQGLALAGKDEFVTVGAGSALGPFYLPIFRQTLQLSLPPQARANRTYWVVLRLWREQDGSFVGQNVLGADRRRLSDTQVVLDELVIPADPVNLPPAPRARFENGSALYSAELPEKASAGDTLTLAMTWHAEADGERDYTQFLHFVHDQTGELWAFDQPPLGARLPTRLWYSGLADTETWAIPLPAELAPGRYLVWTGLYRASDLERLAAADAAGAPYPDARAPLGAIVIEPA